MKVAIHRAAGAAGARLVESFHLASSPTPVALAFDAEGLVRAGRMPVALREVEPGSAESLADALSGCSAAVLLSIEEERAETIVARATAFAEAARHTRLRRVVMISDVAVYGPNPGKPWDEASPLPRHDPGSRAAALSAAESVLLETCARNHPVPCVLRAGWLYGARVPDFAALASEITAPKADPDGKNAARHGLHIDNLVAAVRAALSAKTGDQRIFSITDTGTITRDEFRRAVAAALGHSRADGTSELPAKRKTTPWNTPTSRAERLLGYRPEVDLEEAIRRSCAWWKFTRE